MSIDSAPDDLLHASLLGLRGVSAKKLFGDQAFFVAGRMFAFQRDGALVLKLPERDRREVLTTGQGKPFFVGDAVPFGRWVEVRLKDVRAAHSLALIAHAAARVSDRAGPRKRRKRTTAGR